MHTCVRGADNVYTLPLSLFAKASAFIMKKSCKKSVDSSVSKMTAAHIDGGPVASSIAMKNRIFINVPCPGVALQE